MGVHLDSDLDGDGRNDVVDVNSTVTVVGTETVSVPAGTFTATKVETKTTDPVAALLATIEADALPASEEAISEIDPLRGTVLHKLSKCAIYPASHYVSSKETLERAIEQIRVDLGERIRHFRAENMLLEAQRIEQRTFYDIEMMEEMGFCQGIENYSRHIAGRKPGERPWCLLDYFPEDFLVVVDESHVTLPQIRGMYGGDRSRKTILVEHGFLDAVVKRSELKAFVSRALKFFCDSSAQ